MITKIRGVMKKSDIDLGSDSHTFEAREDDNNEVYRMVVLKEAEFEELGRPEVITVAIVPGDKLNPVSGG